MGMAAVLGCACVRPINTENANNMTCHYDPSGEPNSKAEFVDLFRNTWIWTAI
jgi:hypothetical protein